jgi:hypothetical protein
MELLHIGKRLKFASYTVYSSWNEVLGIVSICSFELPLIFHFNLELSYARPSDDFYYNMATPHTPIAILLSHLQVYIIICQTTEQAGEMIHMILYEKECKGLGGPRRYLHEARALSRDVSRARRWAQRDCPSTPPTNTPPQALWALANWKPLRDNYTMLRKVIVNR